MNTNECHATGRRKTSVARVRLSPGVGRVTVNGKGLDEYFTTDQTRNAATDPLAVVDGRNSFDVRVNVSGGGVSGQAGAVRLGIARALLDVDANFRPLLKSQGMLTRDPRAKERKKCGKPKARKSSQYSKR